MRHPLLRILMALLIGVCTPMCCCRAMALAGSVCDGRFVTLTEAESCCQKCSRDHAPDQRPEAPAHDDSCPPGGCPSCPSCQGASSIAGVKAEASVAVFEEVLNTLATIDLSLLCVLAPLDFEPALKRPGWATDPPFLKANRDAQRWHCALLV